MTDYDDVWIVIPVYNEGAVIADVVERTRETFPNIVCVDDGSRDDSAAKIATTGAHLVKHPVNLGQGAALQTGIAYALLLSGFGHAYERTHARAWAGAAVPRRPGGGARERRRQRRRRGRPCRRRL